MRPKIIYQMVTSIDGRLLVDLWTPPVVRINADIACRTYEQAAAWFDADG